MAYPGRKPPKGPSDTDSEFSGKDKLGMKPPKGGDYTSSGIWKDKHGKRVGVATAEDTAMVPNTKRNVAGAKKSRARMMAAHTTKHPSYKKPKVMSQATRIQRAARRRMYGQQ